MTLYALLAVVLIMLFFEIGYKLGRVAALDDVASAFKKLQMRDDIRAVIDRGLHNL